MRTHHWRQITFALLACGLAPGLALASSAPPRATTLNPRPITFEPNVGQSDPAVRYLARGGNGTLLLTSDEMVLLVPGAAGTVEPLRTRLSGAQDALCVSGRDERTGRVNYYRGNNPAKWRSGVPTFGAVAYEEVYPGIDLVYHGSDGKLEYDFVVAPGADPDAVRLSFEGANEMAVTASGDLVLRLATATVVQHAPVVYQVVDGARRPVAGRFVVEGEAQVGFEVGSYDRERELVIDPVLGYSTYIGGSGTSEGGSNCCQDGTVDSFGYYLVAGTSNSTDYPITGDAFDPQPNGGTDMVVTAIGPQGDALAYSTYIGGSGSDRSYAIAVGSEGTIYVAGNTLSTDMPTTVGAFDETANGADDIYVAVLTPSGGALVYGTYLGGSGQDWCTDLAADASGQVFVTGQTGSANFPTTPGAYDRTLSGPNDVFVTKFNAAGSDLVFSTYLGGKDAEFTIGGGPSLALNASGNIHVAGFTASRDFPTTVGAYDRSFSGASDAFVTKFAASGASLVYSTYLGGGGSKSGDAGKAIAVDTTGNAYVFGGTDSSSFPTTAGAYDRSYNGSSDWFISKLNPSGSSLVYSTFLGGSGDDSAASSIALGAEDSAWITGRTLSIDFPTSTDAIDPSASGSYDAVVTGLSSSADSLVYSSYLGGTLAESSFGIGVLGNSVYLTGTTLSSNFPTTPGCFDDTLTGGSDLFVTRIDF